MAAEGLLADQHVDGDEDADQDVDDDPAEMQAVLRERGREIVLGEVQVVADPLFGGVDPDVDAAVRPRRFHDVRKGVARQLVGPVDDADDLLIEVIDQVLDRLDKLGKNLDREGGDDRNQERDGQNRADPADEVLFALEFPAVGLLIFPDQEAGEQPLEEHHDRVREERDRKPQKDRLQDVHEGRDDGEKPGETVDQEVKQDHQKSSRDIFMNDMGGLFFIILHDEDAPSERVESVP